MNASAFNVNSFTQNLSSVLSDPSRTRSETSGFFTRQWGDQFVPRDSVPAAPTIPRINATHFRPYLSTTAKKHRQYQKAKRALRRILSRHAEQNNVEPDEVPGIFFTTSFNLHQIACFETVFLEPRVGESDALVPENLERRRSTPSTSVVVQQRRMGRPESSGSLTSIQSLQNSIPVEASGGRFFRPYQLLNNRLEYFHDTVGILLNNQLEDKSEEFWRTVNSYGALHGELESAIDQARTAREELRNAKLKLFTRTQHIVQLHQASMNRQRLLSRLHDIACLRDAQTTVQMLLNQDDFPKALECIETAQEVLSSDLRGVLCFRHLSSQLEELHKAIGKMLQEEFVSLIQREFAKPVENEADAGYQETQLQPVILGLLRCQEFRFIQVFRAEIVDAVKNTVRQIVKSRILEFDSEELLGLDPSLMNLGERIGRMTLAQWMDILGAVFHSLYLLCCRVLSIQELILENLQRVRRLRKKQQRHLDEDKAREKLPQIGIDEVAESLVERLAATKLLASESNASLNFVPNRHRRTDSAGSIISAVSLPPQSLLSNRTSGGGDYLVPANPRISKSETTSMLEQDDEELDRRTETPGSDQTEVDEERPVSASVDQFRPSRASTNAVDDGAETRLPSSAQLSMPCHDLDQLRTVVPLLLDHAILTCEERVGKLIVARSKDTFLEKCDPRTFAEICQMIANFVERCRQIHPSKFDGQKEIKKMGNGTIPNGGTALSHHQQSALFNLNGVRSPIQSIMQQQTTKFLTKFFERKRQKLANILDAEQWRQVELPPVFQRLIDQYNADGVLSDIREDGINTSGIEDDQQFGGLVSDASHQNQKDFVTLNGEHFVVIGTSLLLLRILAQYCDLLSLFPQCSMELVLNVVELLKNFNSRTCQLILGAGALQLVGLKTISVKNLALASRSLQLIVRFIPVIRAEFATRLPVDRQNTLRHFDKVHKDFDDHINEIDNKLLSVIDQHLIGALNDWKLDGKTPTAAFQHVVKQIGKFYSGYSSIMPAQLTTKMLHRVHSNFKLYLRQHLQSRGISPHDSVAYGMASQDFAYYVENMRAFPDCKSFPDDTLSDVLLRPS